MELYNYLVNKGYTPVRKNERDAWFKSPFRDEKTASFKVNIQKNIWFDFGENKGGGMKDLLKQLNDDSFLLHNNLPKVTISNSKIIDETKSFLIIKTSTLTAYRLKEYLIKRRIPIDIANNYCKQINYLQGDKFYYSIGFENDIGGFELRNAIFKNCFGKKTKTTLNNGSNSVIIFEGFFDFLSFITLFGDDQKSDFIILNSVTTYLQVKDELSRYISIDLYLDNDPAGDSLTNQIIADFGRVIDNRNLYKNHKDLNEYLCEFKKKI
jgi:hypothetical protein